MKTYKMIRGKVTEERCTNYHETWGSPLYCECGCQTPRETDPDINLNGVTVSRKSETGYADYILSRDGQEVGILNTQYNYIAIDGHEFIGVEKDFIAHLLNEAFRMPNNEETISAGSTLEETAALERTMERIALDEQDERNKKHPGYCTKCHTYCYGDCKSN